MQKKDNYIIIVIFLISIANYVTSQYNIVCIGMFSVYLYSLAVIYLLSIKNHEIQDTIVTQNIKLFNNERSNIMSELWAKVKFQKDKTPKDLITSFFRNFQSGNIIVIKDNEATLKLDFQQPNMDIITAIANYDVIELICDNLDEFNQGETIISKTEVNEEQEITPVVNSVTAEQIISESEKSVELEQGTATVENSAQAEQIIPESEESVKLEQDTATTENSVTAEQIISENEESVDLKQDTLTTVKNLLKTGQGTIPELDNIAAKATSFEHFANLVSEWLEMDKVKSLFTNIIILSAELKVISHDSFKYALRKNNIPYKQSEITKASKQVSKYFSSYPLTLLPFLRATQKYKDYPFKKIDECSRVKMNCLPEIKNFEETLARVDKTQPIEKRVRYILDAMGLCEENEENQNLIFKIAYTAMKIRNMDFNIIFVKANIPVVDREVAQMTFSTFLTNFVDKYESGKKVKVLSFLSELQKIIIYEDEIEKF